MFARRLLHAPLFRDMHQLACLSLSLRSLKVQQSKCLVSL